MPDLSDERKSELCLRCLECCKVLTFGFLYNEEMEGFYRTRGCLTHKVEDMLFVEVDSWCQHLSFLGCTIYAERPESCRVYDGRRHPVLKDRCLWGKEECEDED